MDVTLARASLSDRPVLENLLALHLHDLSEFLGSRPDEGGRFSYPRLPLYWREPGRTPLLFRADGRLAGFGLVARGSLVSGDPEVFDVAEFFVLRGLRRRGIGGGAARAMFALFEGLWEVRVIDRNPAARAFWKRTISRVTGGSFTLEPWEPATDVSWQVFRFTRSAGVVA